MKKPYEKATIELLKLKTADVISASGEGGGVDNETEDEDNPFARSTARSYESAYTNSYNYIER